MTSQPSTARTYRLHFSGSPETVDVQLDSIDAAFERNAGIAQWQGLADVHGHRLLVNMETVTYAQSVDGGAE